MRVLIMAKEGEQTGAGTPPTAEAMAAHQKFNEELVKAGVVVASGRLAPSSQGKRVRFDGKKRTVIGGPLTETKEPRGGDWVGAGGAPCRGPPWGPGARGRRGPTLGTRGPPG